MTIGRIVCLCLSVVFVANRATFAQSWGDLKGKFVYDGTAPTPSKLAITKDIECCGKYADEIVEQGILVGQESGLSNVFITLRTPKGKKISIHPEAEKLAKDHPAVIDNLHCMFYPHTIGLWAGKQQLVVNNLDPIGQAAKLDTVKNPPINALIPVGGKVEQKFQRPETLPVMLSCGIHPWETAYVLIHDSPYFATTGKDGSFVIRNIPVGDWEFRVWHERSGYLNAKSNWSKGVFSQKIAAGENDMGVVKVAPKLLEKK